MGHFHHKEVDCRQRGCLGIKSENLQVCWAAGWALEEKKKKRKHWRQSGALCASPSL